MPQDHTIHTLYKVHILHLTIFGIYRSICFYRLPEPSGDFPNVLIIFFTAGLYKSMSVQHHEGACTRVILWVFWLTQFWPNSGTENSKIVSVQVSEFGPRKPTCK